MDFKRPLTLRAGDVQLYRVWEDFTEGLIYFMVVFGPWAFGTTQSWSTWTMNLAGYVLGILLAAKWFIRKVKGYGPSRWPQTSARLTAVQLATTAAILGYCLVSAANAYATYHRRDFNFEYHSCISWLPHSFDSALTWPVFWSYLGLACSFWAVRDWLLGKSLAEERAVYFRGDSEAGRMDEVLPARLRRLLWVLALNGGLLAVEGILQRLSGTVNLLFLAQPRVYSEAVFEFGPYADRGNAAQYFILLWPGCVGFWWLLHRPGGFKRKAHHLVLLCAVIMAACPIISTSLGGTL